MSSSSIPEVIRAGRQRAPTPRAPLQDLQGEQQPQRKGIFRLAPRKLLLNQQQMNGPLEPPPQSSSEDLQQDRHPIANTTDVHIR